MSVSWSHDPAERPSAERIKQVVQCPQFCHLIDAVSMDTSVNILSACCVSVEKDLNTDDDDEFGNFCSDCIYLNRFEMSALKFFWKP